MLQKNVWVIMTICFCFLLYGCEKRTGPWLGKANIVSVEWEAKGRATVVVHATVRNDNDYAGRVNVVCDFKASPQWEGFKTQWAQKTVYIEPGRSTTVELWLSRLPTAFGTWKYRVGLTRKSLSGRTAQRRASSTVTSPEIGCYTKKEIIMTTEWEIGRKPVYVPPGVR